MLAQDIDDFDTQIQGEFGIIQQEIDFIDKKDQLAKQNQFIKVSKLIGNLDTLVKAYEIQIESLEKNQQKDYLSNLKQIQRKYSKLKQSFQTKKQDEVNGQELFGKGNQQNDLSNMNAQELIQVGDKYMQLGNEGLQNILKIAHENEEIANNVELELEKQINQLDRMHDELKDTESVLNRTDKIIRYFLRNLYTDKILMCLIGLIGLTIIALIILNALGYNKGSYSSKDTTTSS